MEDWELDAQWNQASPNNERETHAEANGETERGEKIESFRRWAQQKYARRRLSFWEYTVFFLMSLLFLVLAYSLANMLHALYSEYVLKGKPVVFRHYFLMCVFLFIVFFGLDRYFFRFSVLPY